MHEVTLTVPQDLVRRLARHPLFAASGTGQRGKSHIAWFDTDRFDLHESGISLSLVNAGRTRLQRVRPADDEQYVSAFAGEFDFVGIANSEARTRLGSAQRRGLAVVFEALTQVRSWPLALPKGRTVIARLVRGELRSGERAQPLCELQLAATDAADRSRFSLARDLIGDLGLRLQPASVDERGWHLARNLSLKPVRAATSPVAPQHDCAAALRAIIDACSEQFLRNEPGALAFDDPEYVHQMRVAIRRLRSALRAFAPLIPADAQQRFVAGLREWARELGATRDWDVMLDELILPVAQARADDARLSRLVEAATALRDATRAHCQRALEVGLHHRLIAEVLAYVQCEWTPADADQVPALAEFALARLDALHRKASKAAKRASAQDIPALHRLRIAIKRLRYTVEFFAPLFPRKAVRSYLGRMASLQEDLGLLNDLANAELRLADCASRDPALAEGVAFVNGWYATRLAELSQRIPAELAALAKLRRFWK